MSSPIKLMFITGDPEVARYVVDAGVDRVFVDMEVRGKAERQAHIDAHFSAHSLSDLERVREAVPGIELLARVNPPYEGTGQEVRDAIAAGADQVMLPMFRDANQVREFCQHTGSDAVAVLLAETPQAVVRIEEVAEVEGVGELYFGLNDLQLGLGLDFLFEPVAGGLIEHVASAPRAKGIPFGFGGIGRLTSGLPLSAELVLAEHVRLGSSLVILSRAFHDRARNLAELRANIDMPAEVVKLRNEEARLRKRHPAEVEDDRKRLREAVGNIVEGIARRRASRETSS